MNGLEPSAVLEHLSRWADKEVYIHLEVNRGAYWRNGRARLKRAHVKGDGPWRLFLELDDGKGLIQVDDLTHMELTDTLVICSSFDEQQRLARTIEVSASPFLMTE